MVDPEKPETIENEEAQSETNEGMVEIHQASIEDLDAALKNAQVEEASAASDAPLETGDSQSPENTPATPVAKQTAEPSKSASQEPSSQAPQNEVQGNQAEIERLRRQGEEKELFIQRRGNEIGKLRADNAGLRTQLQTALAQLRNGLEERFQENPVQASNDRDKIKEIEGQIAGIDEYESRAEKVVEAQTFFLRHVDTEKVSITDVADMLKADGIEDQYVNAFKANPWEFTTPEALVQMGKRAQDRKELVQADNDRRLLARHVLHLNEQLKNAQAKPGQVLRQVQKNLNQSPNITAASAAAKGSANSLDPGRVPYLSENELNAALKNATLN